MKIELINKEKVLDLVKSIMDDSPTSYYDLARLQTELFLMEPDATLNKMEQVDMVENSRLNISLTNRRVFMNNKELTISAAGSGQAEKWPKWKRLTTRKANPEEMAQGYTFMWEGENPEIGEEVLVSDGKSVWTDTWTEVDIFVGFEQTDYDSDCWWMPFPSPPQ